MSTHLAGGSNGAELFPALGSAQPRAFGHRPGNGRRAASRATLLPRKGERPRGNPHNLRTGPG